MKADSNYYDDTPLSTRAERLTLLFIALGSLVLQSVCMSSGNCQWSRKMKVILYRLCQICGDGDETYANRSSGRFIR